MTGELEQQVRDRQWQHDFDELSGRATPPDRLDDILARVAARAPDARALGSRRWRPAHLWAAALILLGVTATISVSMSSRDEHGTDDRATAGQPLHPDGNAMAQVADAGQQPPFPDRPPLIGTTQEPRPQQQPKPEAPPAPQPVSGQQPPEQQPADARAQPKGTDPADLAAMRSAEAMLEAEKKLAEQLREGKITGFDRLLPFDELTDWHYRDGLEGLPERIKALSGKKVLMTGFMLPIDEVEGMREFLLVQSLWSCCYGQPPDIHGLVRCVMPADETIDYMFDPLKVVGTFKVEATVMDGYCVDIYQLHIESVEPIR